MHSAEADDILSSGERAATVSSTGCLAVRTRDGSHQTLGRDLLL